MNSRQPMTIVIRIPDVKVSRAELNASLNKEVDRYEESRPNAGKYAQITIEDSEDQWHSALRCIQSIRDPVRELLSSGLIGIPALDVALELPESSPARSWIIPADLAAAAGGAGIKIEISVYLACDADASQSESEL
jgi:hypothetical protein